MKEYIQSSEEIDYLDSSIKQVAVMLAKDTNNEIDLAHKVYCFVRDEIKHSIDIGNNIITCNASEVLKLGHGLCLAKAHLLAAILRCLGIPTGFCYQGIWLNDCIVLHGLNAIYLESLGKWIRVDARGNKPGINAEFSIAEEKLAFTIREDIGEFDCPVIFSKPDSNVLNALNKYKSLDVLLRNLPNKLA